VDDAAARNDPGRAIDEQQGRLEKGTARGIISFTAARTGIGRQCGRLIFKFGPDLMFSFGRCRPRGATIG
jgi:hypothetical protein